MKKISSFLLLSMFVGVLMFPPAEAFAKRGGDDDSSGHHGRHHSDDDDSYDDSDDDSSDDSDDSTDDSSSSNLLEVEADVFTDTTIVKVELPTGRKVVFETTADTKAEVVDAVVAKLGLNKADVEAVIDFEIEDRASRVKERARVTGHATSTANNNESLRAQIATLQQLIERLLAALAKQNA